MLPDVLRALLPTSQAPVAPPTAPDGAGLMLTERNQATTPGKPDMWHSPRPAGTGGDGPVSLPTAPQGAVKGRTPRRGTPYVSRGPTGNRLAWCKRTGRVFVLGCSRGTLTGKVCPCGQLDCLTCKEGPQWKDPEEAQGAGLVGRRRAGRLYERFGAPDLGRVVVTWGPFAGELTGRAAVELRRLAHDAVHAWAREVWGCDVGVYSFAHPAGDKRPADWLPHVHLQVPLWGAVLDGGQVASMGPLAPMVPPEALARLRAHVAAILEGAGLVDAEQDGDGAWWALDRRGRRITHTRKGAPIGPQPTRRAAIERQANAWYQWEDSPSAKLHALRYDGRSFPAWFAGDLPRSLRIGRATGLLSPGARLCQSPVTTPAGGSRVCRECAGCVSLAAWRDAMRGTPPTLADPTDPIERIRAGLQCYCCGEAPTLYGCASSQGWHHVIADAWARSPDSPEMQEVGRLFGRGPPGKAMHDHQAQPPGRSRVTKPDVDDIPF